jgi:hypothetical protein
MKLGGGGGVIDMLSFQVHVLVSVPVQSHVHFKLFFQINGMFMYIILSMFMYVIMSMFKYMFISMSFACSSYAGTY